MESEGDGIFMNDEKSGMKKQGRMIKAVKEDRKGLLWLGGLLLFSCLIIYGAIFISGRQFIYLDVGSDTMHSFYSVYCWAVKHIREMDFSFWCHEIGMGGSVFNYASVLLDPFALPVLAGGMIGGTGCIAGLLAWVQVGKIFACGFVCYFFLSYFTLSRTGRVAASYCYALNGFLVLWGQHYWLGTASFWMILTLSSIEKIRKTGCFGGRLILTTAWMLMQSPYIGYMTLLTAGFYTVFRTVGEKRGFFWRRAVRELGSVFVPVLLGVFVSAIVFLPVTYLILKVSNRLGSEMGLAEKLWYYFKTGYMKREYVAIGLRFFSNNMQGIGSDYVSYTNYYEVPQFFFSSVFPLFLIQYLWNRGKCCLGEGMLKRENVVWCLAVVLIAFIIANPAGSLIYNAFAYPFGRYTFVLMPLWALVVAFAWPDRDNNPWNLGLLALSSAGMAVVYIRYARRNGIRTKTGMLLMLLAGTVVFCAVGIWLLQQRRKAYATGLILAAIGIGLTADDFVTTNLRGMADWEMPALTGEGRSANTREALAFLQAEDDGVYRVEKTYTDISEVMDSMAFGYHGISGYNSMLNGRLQEFHQKLWPGLVAPGGWFRQYYTAVSEDWVLSSLLGVKYLLTEDDSRIYGPDYEKEAEFGQVTVLKNRAVDTIAYLSAYAITEKQAEEMSEEKRHAVLQKAMVLPEEMMGNVAGVTWLTSETVMEDLPDVWSGLTGEISMEWTKDGLKGELWSDRDQVLAIMIPWEDGWQFWLDGEAVFPMMIDYAFPGVSIGEGAHTVELQYTPPLWKEGVLLSGAGIVVSIVLWYWHEKMRRRPLAI